MSEESMPPDRKAPEGDVGDHAQLHGIAQQGIQLVGRLVRRERNCCAAASA